VGSLSVQNLPLNRGDDQITPDFVTHLKSFSMSDPSIDPVIDKFGSISVSDIDVAINAFRSYFSTILLDLDQKPPTFPTTQFLFRIKIIWQVLQVRTAFSWFCDLHPVKFVVHALSLLGSLSMINTGQSWRSLSVSCSRRGWTKWRRPISRHWQLGNGRSPSTLHHVTNSRKL
jgi:hypothetical protein